MAFQWRADDDPALKAGLVALWFFRGSGSVLLRNPIDLTFQEGSGPPLPPLDPRIKKPARLFSEMIAKQDRILIRTALQKQGPNTTPNNGSNNKQ